MQQTDKHGPVKDEALKHQTQGMERAGRSTHAQEWADPEPPGEDQPQVSAFPNEPAIGGTPVGMTPLDVEERSLLARHLGGTMYPATKDELMQRLHESHAPDRFLKRVASLPESRYENLRDVAEHLGIHVESHRF